MTISGTPTRARRQFDEAMTALHAESASALELFRAATSLDPSMADAWLGRLAAGEEGLDPLERLHSCSTRLRRESNRLGVALDAAVKAGPHLSIRVSEPTHVTIALASAYIEQRAFDKAEELLDDPALLEATENHLWRQYVRCYLFFGTQRWPDLLSEAARLLPGVAEPIPALTAGVNTLAAHAAAHLGQGRVALDWARRVDLDPEAFPMISADLAYIRGMAHRQIGEEERAQFWLSKAAVGGVLIEPARSALADQRLQLVTTDEERINSRTDRWDPHSERSAEDRAADANAERRAQLLAEGRALLSDQVGLEEVKRAVAELEDQIEVRELRLAHGLPVANQTNHMLLVGPPGTGKTTTAQALGKIYAGLGIVRHPEIIEVKRSDFCGEHIGSSGPKTNELIDRSMGRILFFDEFYSLVERHHDGRPDMIGMEAVNQLMVALEVHRFDFCFIGAGYEKEVDEFLAVNPGLTGRFNRKLRFDSYRPADLVEIAVRYGRPRASVIEEAGREELAAACRVLRAYSDADGRHGIDIMQNGRFARNVVERAERLRDSRVAGQHRQEHGSVTVTDLETVRAQDILTAITEACAEKNVPLGLSPHDRSENPVQLG